MRSLIICAFAIVSIFTFSQSAEACTCRPAPEGYSISKQVREARSSAGAVFTGEVVEITESSDGYYREIRIKVASKWKGVKSKEVVVYTGRGGGDCGYSFSVGGKYLVYASRIEDRLFTNICQRTTPIQYAAEDLAVLKRRR